LSILQGYVPTTANDFEKLRGAVYSIPLIIFIIFAPGGLAGLVQQVGGSFPTWRQNVKTRLTSWAGVLRLVRQPAGADSQAAESHQDPEEETHH
jgi:hypothetical protein